MQESIAFIAAREEEEQEREWMRQVLETGSWSGQHVQRRRDGTPFWAESVITVVKDDSDRPVGLIKADRDITEPKRVHDVVRASRERLRNLAARLRAVREKERTLIAREIHDELGQALTGLKMDMSWLTKELPPGRTHLRERARSMVTLIDKTLDTVRQLSSRLRPAVLDDLGLAAAIEWQADEFTSRTAVECTLDLAGDLELDPDRATAAFRIVQEALTNVARHAAARHVAIELRVVRGRLVVEVRDDGKGITEEQTADTRSLGVIGMRERAGDFGGRVHLHQGPEGGTVVTLDMPLPAEGRSRGTL